MTIEIKSRENPHIKEFLKLKKSKSYRYRSCQIAVEGPNLVGEAVKAGLIPRVVFVTENYLKYDYEKLFGDNSVDSRILILTEAIFSYIAETDTPQTVAAIFPFNFNESAGKVDDTADPVLVLDHLQDPGNMGTIVRTAAAAGVARVFYSRGCTDPYSPKALRATAGAVFRILPLLEKNPSDLVSKLKKRGFQIVAATADSGEDYRSVDYTRPTALIVGNEAGGISENILDISDLRVTIPLKGEVESLNAAVAAGVLLFEIIRARA
ncbi:MAG: TrmH family RNA methyltransferase [Dethiobacteria bacterium]